MVLEHNAIQDLYETKKYATEWSKGMWRGSSVRSEILTRLLYFLVQKVMELYLGCEKRAERDLATKTQNEPFKVRKI